MQLQPRAQRPDPELWRAVHEAPATLKRNEPRHEQHHESDASEWLPPLHGMPRLHGMPADRLAMTASRQPP